MRRRGFSPLCALALAASLGAALASGCSRPPAPEEVLDLAALFGSAQVRGEKAEFVLGTYELEPSLGIGWRTYGEADRARNRTFRWARWPRSELDFEVLVPRPLTLVLEGLPASSGREPRQIDVELNGHSVGSLVPSGGLAEYRLEVAPDHLERGINRLALVYGEGSTVQPAAARDRAPNLAMAWYRVALEGLAPPAHEPRVDDRGRLFLPLGARVAFPLTVPHGARLASGAVRLTRPADARVEIGLETDGAPLAALATVTEGGSIDLPLGAAGQPALLSLTAIADPAAAGASGPDGTAGTRERAAGFLIEAPRVVAPATGQPDGTRRRPAIARPNVLVYLVDTLRNDRLGCYGSPVEGVTPHLDRFAAEATLFENARAQASWTLPSVTSVFTGVWPPAHGQVMPRMRLPEEALTMAEVFQGAGYETSAVVANGQITEGLGMAQGFEHHLYLSRHARDSDLVHRWSIKWLEERDRTRPFFLYAHTFDPHAPYLPKEKFRRRFAPDSEDVYQAIVENPKRSRWEPEKRDLLLALYDALVAQNDDAFGRTLDYLRREGLYDDALIVFLADHGEEFYEHQGWGHGANLYGATINVPLIVKLPRQRTGRRVTRLVQQVDLLPTMLDYLGLEAPAVLEGRSLLADARGEAVTLGSPSVYSHTQRFGNVTHSVIEGEWKFVRRFKDERIRRMLFEWDRDRLEAESRTGELPIRAAVLEDLLRRRLMRGPYLRAEKAELSAETLEELRALGYIQ